MSSTRAELRGACCAQFSDRTYHSEPKLLYIRATSVLGSRTQHQHEELTQHNTCRMYDIADQGPHEFLRNIALMHERSPSARPLPREHLKTPPSNLRVRSGQLS
ncbi:hypothetical protein EVAR_98194_1 [Eumeta japonica]|uniref:Uncharacterized protein n=1 Tax=Eumeta variegata TaxID=151549 RepID=A0A4C1Y6S5_EUMVA|nr:hypothetical protein EVAR_98194_1 [Eumeta japonica]